MLVWLRSPRGSTATATAVAAILALFWLAPWSKPLPSSLAHLPIFPLASESGQPAEPARGATSTAETPAALSGKTSVKQPVRGAADAPATPAVTGTTASTDPSGATRLARTEDPGPAKLPVSAAPGPAPASVPQAAPSFDVVRVEPSGATVIAGRAEPGSVVTLMDAGQVLAHATVDGAGQFALLPPDLAEGSHYLTLQSTPAGGAPLASAQGVAVAVPHAGGAGKAVVAMLSPDQGVRVLSDGTATGPAGVAAGSAATSLPITIQAVEASRGGKFTASGIAKAGSQSRLYLNGAFLADVTAGKDGRWAVRVEKGMRPGQYVVRADQLEGDGGKVVHRAEVPFTYPVALQKGGGKQLLMARAEPLPASADSVSSGAPIAVKRSTGTTASAAAAPGVKLASTPLEKVAAAGPLAAGPVAAIVSDLRTATVSRGDSLWRISRKMLGRGMSYTAIYASNAGQIRDPALIYPGQIFVVPQASGK